MTMQCTALTYGLCLYHLPKHIRYASSITFRQRDERNNWNTYCCAYYYTISIWKKWYLRSSSINDTHTKLVEVYLYYGDLLVECYVSSAYERIFSCNERKFVIYSDRFVDTHSEMSRTRMVMPNRIDKFKQRAKNVLPIWWHTEHSRNTVYSISIFPIYNFCGNRKFFRNYHLVSLLQVEILVSEPGPCCCYAARCVYFTGWDSMWFHFRF